MVLVCFLGLFLWAWHMRGTRQLCNGYRLVWMSGVEAVIVDSANNVVSSGTVTRYATNCPLITGYTSKQGFPPETNPVEGWFLIDTDTGFHQLGMTEPEWQHQLLRMRWQTPHMRETHPTHPN